MTRYALLSVWDKRGVVELARGLAAAGYALLSSGGTCKALRDAGLSVTEVADHTGFPEMMGGRLKTLHPKVHGGILGRREAAADRQAMAEAGIDPIDVVVVNLYPFRETLARGDATRAEIVEKIDIGGPAMVRSAAKNHAHVAVVVDPGDYARVTDSLARHGEIPAELRLELAAKAFSHSAAYDAAIAGWLAGAPAEPFGPCLGISATRLAKLRYGENPHQAAALYGVTALASGPNLAAARQVGGKELSYNNLLDLDAALAAVLEQQRPACIVVKHNNPCGAAAAESLPEAFAAALAGDPVSAFGGILAVNRPLDRETAAAMAAAGTFFEAIVAPAVAADAMVALAAAKWGASVRVLDLGGMPDGPPPWVLRQVSGGLLVQQPDVAPPITLTTATARPPTAAELAGLEFAWQVCKHVKSNAIVLARVEGACASVVGVGAGQMSRVDAARIAVAKAGDSARGAVLASDAFFPFADGLETALAAGVTAVIQPGGSKRDAEVIAAANEAGAAMVFTGLRHFRH